MKNVWITGESGYIAHLFEKYLKNDFNIVNSLSNKELDYFRQNRPGMNTEIDIFDPVLSKMMSQLNTDFIIHTATCRTFDEPDRIMRTHIEGTYYVVRAAQELNIPMFNIIEKTNDPDIYKTKHIGALLAQTYYRNVFNVYIDELFGKENFNRNINKLLNNGVKDIYFNIFDHGDYLYSKDFVNEIKKLISSNIYYSNFHIIGYRSVIGEIIDLFEEKDLIQDFNIIDNFEQVPTFDIRWDGIANPCRGYNMLTSVLEEMLEND